MAYILNDNTEDTKSKCI